MDTVVAAVLQRALHLCIIEPRAGQRRITTAPLMEPITGRCRPEPAQISTLMQRLQASISLEYCTVPVFSETPYNFNIPFMGFCSLKAIASLPRVPPAVYWREMPGNLLCRLWHATFQQPELLPHRPAAECMATKACISWNRDAIRPRREAHVCLVGANISLPCQTEHNRIR